MQQQHYSSHTQTHYSQSTHTKYQQSNKLQALWNQLQDLSQVQDQSRNQQIPHLINDTTILSKHSETQSFLDTVQILEQSFHQAKETLKPNTITRNDSFPENNFLSKNNPNTINNQTYNEPLQSNNEFDQQSYQPFYQFHHHSQKLNHNLLFSQKVQNYNSVNSLYYNQSGIKNSNLQSLTKQYSNQQQSQKYLQNTQDRVKQLTEINQKLLSDNKKLFDQCIKLKKITLKNINHQNNTQKDPNFTKTIIQHQNNTQKGKQLTMQQNIIKTRIDNTEKQKQILSQRQKQSQKQSERLIKQQKVKMYIVELENKTYKQRIKTLQGQNKQLISNYQERIQKYQQMRQQQSQDKIKQKQQLLKQNQLRKQLQNQLRFQLQKQLERKFIMRIGQLEEKINLKQKQLIIKTQSEKQSITNYKSLSNLLKQEKQTNSTLSKELNQLKHQLNQIKSQLTITQQQYKSQNNTNQSQKSIQQSYQSKDNAKNKDKDKQGLLLGQFQQKQSRTSSVKSTSISYNGSVFDKSLNQSCNLETLLKDKERQITNIKIVHQSEMKKYKQTIKQLQNQLKTIIN